MEPLILIPLLGLLALYFVRRELKRRPQVYDPKDRNSDQ